MQHETKKLFRVALLVLLISFQQVAHACDLCGCFIGVLPYDNQSSLGLMHRYRIFSGYPDASGGMIFPQGAYRLSAPPSVLHTTNPTVRTAKDFESYKVIELRGKWFIHPRIELNFILPFAENRSSYNGEKERIDAMGDAVILAGYHLIRKTGEGEFRHRLVVGLGIKLPSGKFNSKGSDGERISLLMQTGTGSTDGIVYLAYTGGGHNFRWGTTLTEKFSGVNKYREQLSPGTSGMASLGYLVTIHSWKFLPQVQGYGEYLRGLWTNAEFLEGTGMNCILLGPALDVYKDHLALSLAMQLPVHEQTTSYNLENRARISIGLTWSFNQEKFIFNSPKKS